MKLLSIITYSLIICAYILVLINSKSIYHSLKEDVKNIKKDFRSNVREFYLILVGRES